MDYIKFWDDIFAAARLDPEYQQCLMIIQQREPAFLAICEMLTQEQRDALNDYISACEALEECMTLLAYQLGKTSK